MSNIDVHIAESIQERDEQLVNMNIVQLERSMSKEGKAITPEYSPSYAKYKGFEHPDLKDTGAFHEAAFLSVDENKGEFFIGSEDEKTPMLLARYERSDQTIFGIPESDQPEAKKLTAEPFIDKFKRLVFGND